MVKKAGYGLDIRGSIMGRGRGRDCFFVSTSRPTLGSAQPPIQWVPGVKRSGHEADYSPPYSTVDKNVWSCIYTTPYVFIA